MVDKQRYLKQQIALVLALVVMALLITAYWFGDAYAAPVPSLTHKVARRRRLPARSLPHSDALRRRPQLHAYTRRDANSNGCRIHTLSIPDYNPRT
jgi:hypothetical protein